jgi:hypothetical protein
MVFLKLLAYKNSLRGLTNQLLYLLSYASQIRQGHAITVPFEAGAIPGKVVRECNRLQIHPTNVRYPTPMIWWKDLWLMAGVRFVECAGLCGVFFCDLSN